MNNVLQGDCQVQGQALSPFASLRGNYAKGLARRAQRSFPFASLRTSADALRMTARTPLQSAAGKPSLQTSRQMRGLRILRLLAGQGGFSAQQEGATGRRVWAASSPRRPL